MLRLRIGLAALLFLTLPAFCDDALREVDRAEPLEGSTEIVMARFTGRTGSVKEKRREGYSCLFRYEEWVFESAIKGSGPWKTGL